MQCRAPLGDIDPVAAKHGLDAFGKPAGSGEFAQQTQSRFGDALLGVIEIEANTLCIQSLATIGIGSEQFAQMPPADLRSVFL